MYPPFCFAFYRSETELYNGKLVTPFQLDSNGNVRLSMFKTSPEACNNTKDCSYVGKSVVKIPATRITFACAVVVVVRWFRAATQSTSVVIANWQANSDEISTARVMFPMLYPTTILIVP